MSTAIIISGQMRTFTRCYPTQRWQVYRHYEGSKKEEVGIKKSEPHFFVSCCDDENADSAELLRQHYANVHIEKWSDPTDLPEIPDELGAHAPYANAASHHQLMLQHWGNRRAWQFFQARIADCRLPIADFKTVIRMRPDNLFHRFVKPNHYQVDLYHTDSPWPKTCLTPWWGKFGGVNDRLAIMGIKAAAAYFNTYNRIPELLAAGCPFHPESLVAASLLNSSILLHTSLLAHFSTLRLNNDQRWPEIAAEDLAELISNR